MEISLRLILVATLLLITAGIVLAVMTGQVGEFTDFLDQSSQDAECGIWETRYEDADTADKKQEISNEAPDSCGDIGGGEAGDGPNVGGDCSSLNNENTCIASGKCTWSGNQCVPK